MPPASIICGELGEVVGGGEHAGMARDAAHAIGERILDLAPAQLGALEDPAGAMRFLSVGDGRKVVSRMPSGWKMCWAA